jgi:hypothetical protein
MSASTHRLPAFAFAFARVQLWTTLVAGSDADKWALCFAVFERDGGAEDDDDDDDDDVDRERVIT